IEAPAGSGALSFDPGGRVGFIVNPVEDAVHILSAAKGAIVQTADVGPEPDQVTFTENLAYVRSLGSEIVLMIPLESVGEEGPVPVIDFSGGHVPFGLGEHPSAAAGIVPAPNGLAVLVANPIDKSIYYYAEGMAAPMGEFSNYGREARAVLVVDKSLKEASPGIYTTSVTIERSGLYGIYFLLDYPSLSHRFDLEVETGPLEKGRDPGPRLELTIEAPRGPVPPAEPVTLRFLARDPVTERPVEGIRDLGVLACRSSLWQKRGWARPVAAGVYEWTLTPPEEGIYLVFAQVPSHRFRYHETRRAVLRVENPGQDSTKSRNKDEKKSLPTSSR
ncbi:MAG: YncE family protein, partial [Planctomycetota bacterium]